MTTRRSLYAFAIALAACSGKPPATSEPVSQPAAPPPASASAPPADVPAGPVSAAPAASGPDHREATLAQTVGELIENAHLLRPHLDDSLSRIAFAAYLDRLDATKMFLRKSDRDQLGVYADKIDDELRAGSLELAHVGQKLYTDRVNVVQAWVAELLAKPFDYTKQDWIELDPKKIDAAADDTELKDRWRKRLQLEVMERVSQMEGSKKAQAGKPVDPNAPPIPETAEGREQKARDEIAKSYAARFVRLRTPANLEPASDLLNAVTSSVDPHSDYLPPAEKANFDIQMTGQLEGIGAVLREKDHLIEIAELVPGGATWRQGGLAPGDLILSVVPSPGKEPVDVFDLRINDVVGMIRGPKGTVVKLRVQKASGEQATVSITRDVIVIESAYARGAILSRPGKPSYGYILLPSFYGGQGPGQRTAAGDVARLLTEMKDKKVAGVILDIRDNGGGLLTDAVKLTGELIDRGPVVQVEDSSGHRDVLSDDDSGELYDGPVIVMIDKFSASASEIVAGALQDYHRALIVGTKTHGKGTVQTVADLDRVAHSSEDLGSLKLTIEQFFRPSGSSTQRKAVSPDVELPDPIGYVDTRESTLDHAIPWKQIDAAPHTDWPSHWNIATLVSRSAARVAKSPLLSKIAASTAVLKSRREDTKEPLQKAAWEARRAQQKAELDAASPDLEHAPAQFTVTPLEDASAPPPPPPPAGAGSGAAVDPTVKWRDALARDPWVAESLNIFGDLPK